MGMTPLSVKQLNMYIKSILESDPNLRQIFVKGEVSNFVCHQKSGHFYFTLKDSEASVKVVMFKWQAEKVAFIPTDGMSVFIRGKISLFERDGLYQLYADEMIPEGIGPYYLAFLQLKDRLEREGLFAPEKKMLLPKYPKEIGICTSPTGAAIRDIISIIKRRCPIVNIKIYPCIVQGKDCAPSVISGIKYFNSKRNVDLIIITRGGGSYEDLSGFNDEALSREVVASKIPIISAIGHEIDYTILDFAADLRAPTPSAAAEIAVLDLTELLLKIKKQKENLTKIMMNRLSEKTFKLNALSSGLDINEYINKKSLYSDKLYDLAEKHGFLILNTELHRFQNCIAKLSVLSPLSVLNRGYAIVENNQNKVITSVDNINETDDIKITLKDGVVYGVALRKSKNEL